MFKYSAVARAVLSLLAARLNPRKALRDYDKIVRFGLAAALYGVFFKLLRQLLSVVRRKTSGLAWVSRDAELFVTCGLAAFALKASHPKDFGIFRVVLLSRAFIALLHLVSEATGLFTCAKPAA